MTSPDEPAGAGELRRDARDLRRGVAINALGYLARVAYPVLLGVAVALYGAAEFGVFTAAQAALLLVLRLALLGLDKGVLWWVPRQAAGAERRGLRPVLVTVLVTSTLATLVLGLVLAPLLARWSGRPEAAVGLRWMAAGLVPLALTEVLVHAALGRRRMEAQVLVKEVLAALVLVLAAVLLYHTGLREHGLALAFLLSALAGLGGAVAVFRRVFRDSRSPSPAERVPRALWRYSLPMWLAELANSVLLRLDVLVLAVLTEPGVVGVYGVVVQVGNAIRAVRRAFDPIVLAIVAQIGARHDARRLRAGFSHATALVIVTQMPVYAFLLVFTPWILPLLGPGFAGATPAVLIFCAFWILNGVVGLNGLVVSGYGRSDLVLLNVLVAIAAQALLLWLLVPRFGLEGAAVAVGAAYTVQNLVQAAQARWITGAWSYDRRVAVALGLAAAAVVAMGLAWLGLTPLGAAVARPGAFLVFLVAGGLGLLGLVRCGRLAL